MKAAIVVPTARHEQISNFLRSWRDEFQGHEVIVIEDNPEPLVDLSPVGVSHYSWKDIDNELGSNSWIIPRRTDCIRSFGFYKAWQKNVDLIVTLDDDCFPVERGFIAKHWEALNSVACSPAWTSTVKGGIPRGVPYFETNRKLECLLNHGLWKNVPDFDAVTQMHCARLPASVTPIEQIIPLRNYFPMCGMNLAFKAELAPIMYFLLMGKDWPYDRFGDIWCGVLAKKICDHLGYAVRSGQPLVDHQRASNVWENLRKEAAAYQINDTFWKDIDSARLTGSSFTDCYRELANRLTLPGDYWSKLRTAMHVWIDLFTSQMHRRDESSPNSMTLCEENPAYEAALPREA